VIQEALISQFQEGNETEIYIFEKILGHRTVSNGKIEVELLWDDGEATWEPVVVMRKYDPITLAEYTKQRKLLDQRGCKWAKRMAKNEKKLMRFLKSLKASKRYKKKSFGIRYKFGVKLPRTGDVRGAHKLDQENRNKLWFED
jgi:hypothetical protein